VPRRYVEPVGVALPGDAGRAALAAHT
jgi:hypothetical protein